MTPTPTALAPVESVRRDLDNLIDETRIVAGRARRRRLDRVLRYARSNGFALEAARQILDTLGAEYVATAEAVVTAAFSQLDLLTDAIDAAADAADAAVRERVA